MCHTFITFLQIPTSTRAAAQRINQVRPEAYLNHTRLLLIFLIPPGGPEKTMAKSALFGFHILCYWTDRNIYIWLSNSLNSSSISLKKYTRIFISSCMLLKGLWWWFFLNEMKVYSVFKVLWDICLSKHKPVTLKYQFPILLFKGQLKGSPMASIQV